MPSYDDLADAAPGDERDAFLRALAYDAVEAAAARQPARGLLPASRPTDVARALGRDRPRQMPRLGSTAR